MGSLVSFDKLTPHIYPSVQLEAVALTGIAGFNRGEVAAQLYKFSKMVSISASLGFPSVNW
jgi:hypothetical protein